MNLLREWHDTSAAFLLAISIALMGCAANTLAQDRTWAAYTTCQALLQSRLKIEQVYPDGRWSWRPTSRAEWGDWRQLNSCMSDEIARLHRLGA